MHMKKSIRILRLAGLSFLLVFFIFFLAGGYSGPINLELKKADNSLLFNFSSTIQEREKSESVRKKAAQPILRETMITEMDTIAKNGSSEKKSNIDITEVGDRVLLMGDSQLEGIQNPVSAYCEKNNHELLATIIWYGSSTKQWAITDTLQYYLDLYQPTVVLFAIGLNELFVRDLDKRTSYIRRIKKVFEDQHIRYSWIGPAAWTTDKGIIEVMSRETGDHFFSSHLLKLERANDGRHPSRSASKLWFDEIAISLTKNGLIDFSNKVDALPKLKFTKTILLKVWHQ